MRFDEREARPVPFVPIAIGILTVWAVGLLWWVVA